MRRNKSLSTCPSSQESIWGFTYLAFQLLFLPILLNSLNIYVGLSKSELNFVFFFLNFLAVICIFHDFLGRSARQMVDHPAYFCQAVILGVVAYFACAYCVKWLIRLLCPGFANLNDASMTAMYSKSRLLMLLGTVILVPPVEECLYRGLIFRNLYSKSRVAAYIVSILAFTAIHIMGFVKTYSPLELCMAILQYLPAGLCLAWAYTKADTIFAPIFIHAFVNFIGIYRGR